MHKTGVCRGRRERDITCFEARAQTPTGHGRTCILDVHRSFPVDPLRGAEITGSRRVNYIDRVSLNEVGRARVQLRYRPSQAEVYWFSARLNADNTRTGEVLEPAQTLLHLSGPPTLDSPPGDYLKLS